jgi:hypothetical protein
MRSDAVVWADMRSLTSAYAPERGACTPACQVVVLDIQGLSPFAYASGTVSQVRDVAAGVRPRRDRYVPGYTSY